MSDGIVRPKKDKSPVNPGRVHMDPPVNVQQILMVAIEDIPAGSIVEFTDYPASVHIQRHRH